MATFVTIIVILMLIALTKEILRPGLILLSGAIIFLCAGILTPTEMLEGFSNKGMITVALLFLVSEGVRRSGLLESLLNWLLPNRKCMVLGAQIRMMPVVSFISAFLNNTPVVVIFAPMIKRWAERHKMAPTKLLIPLSFATIFGGMCTLIGTSTNLVVHGMALDVAAANPESGVRGLSMFELGKIGIFIALAGTLYIWLVSRFLLPERRAKRDETLDDEGLSPYFPVEAVIGARFPAINRRVRDFDFKEKYGATLMEIKRAGRTLVGKELKNVRFREGDTLCLMADETFIKNWGDSSFFLMVADSHNREQKMSKGKQWFTILLLLIMILGATVGELPTMSGLVPGMKFDMFFFVCVTTVIMAWTNIFPARKYTKIISWDILVTIASAFAISKAMQNSGMADNVASWAVGLSHEHGAYVLLGVVYLITAVATELMTNNAAAALAFPIAMSIAQHLGVSPMPFIVSICIAASASFCTPIGYQTNLIVQGVGNYRFSDFVKVGLPLSLITMALSLWLIPIFWPF
ncbi:MAG: SLC13 family permease [Bacteroidaceae bacterium]|nr:SLC13 family permease [Bacteroidaceae bacterium]